MTDYERVRSQCLQSGELWEDPDFPAVQSSVFYHQTPPFHFEWRRPKDIYPNPCFVRKNCDTFDVVPGKLGDVWLVSCLGVLYQNKGLFYRVVSTDQRMDSWYAGVFRFRLWRRGQWLEVLVDDRLPTVNGKLVFLQSTHTAQLWPALLEKAYAKLHGSYEALKYGSLLDGLADLTGGITESLPVTSLAEGLSISSLLSTSSIITANYTKSVNEIKLKGLELGMNYKVCNIIKVNSADGPLLVVLLGKPLAPGESSISLLLESSVWKSIPTYERDRLTSTTSGFWMLLSDFQRSFKRLEIVHLDADNSRAEPTLTDKQKWQMKMVDGGWRRGVTAGGCRNNVDLFHINPQLQIVLPDPDTVIISLYQHSIMEPKVIGFSIYKLPSILTEAASASFFKTHKSSINSQYTNSRQVSHRCHLGSGAYLVIPTTFEPREEASFSLRVFSMNPLKMTVMDYIPKMLKPAFIKAPPEADMSAYEPVFLQLADEQKAIDAFELQDLLDVCLPNDYIKSCASIETCRQIVLTLDKNNTGRISLSDFSDVVHNLKSWQLVFKNHTVEKMGVLRAERLRDALQEVGFVVHERALALLVLRYMRKDGMLRFGDFVSAVMHLHRAFSAHYSFSITPPQADAMRDVALPEWLTWALLC